MGALVDIAGYGKLSTAADAKAPLLVVFGGIDVGGVQSGHYMWKYMDAVKDRFHIFVARNNAVNGKHSYDALVKTVKAKSLAPASQILYLFSGGYGPGMDLLPGQGVSLFAAIYLVDIWMGGSVVPDFYKSLVDANAAKVTYVYTNFGPSNDKARDYIAGKVAPRATLVEGKGMAVHMSTNSVAVGKLP